MVHFTLFSHAMGPNGWKVAAMLEELKLTYETKFLNFEAGEQKGPEHTKHNPNGRIPTLIDHENNDFAVWESNAILLYLVDRYDKEKKFTVTSPSDVTALNQWLFFQASGQGPYFGQAFWFSFSHPEKIPSCIERYKSEIVRVLGVLESVLSKQEWLVGGKYTIADLSFLPWNDLVFNMLLKGDPSFNLEKDFPHVAAWHGKVAGRDAVKKVLAVKYELMQQQQQ